MKKKYLSLCISCIIGLLACTHEDPVIQETEVMEEHILTRSYTFPTLGEITWGCSPMLENYISEVLRTTMQNYDPYAALVFHTQEINVMLNYIFCGDIGGGMLGDYDPYSKTISIKDEESVDKAFPEEFIHFAQDHIYFGGITQYLSNGKHDIEFESKAIQDYVNIRYDLGGREFLGIGKQYDIQYIKWLTFADPQQYAFPDYFEFWGGTGDLNYNDFLYDWSLNSIYSGTYIGMVPKVIYYLGNLHR